VVDLVASDLKAVKLEAVILEVLNLEAVDREACAMEAESLYICKLVNVGLWRIEYNKVRCEQRAKQGAGDRLSSDDAEHGVWSPQCMMYAVYAVYSVCWTEYVLYSVLTLDDVMER
jgi:hypothetical protein